MKNLITVIGCLAIIISISSCTADNSEYSEHKTLKIQNTNSQSVTSDTIPKQTPLILDGGDDKDKTQG
ncbi:hypothetical protein [uncultured Flavobacterium sp.]|uniref:hypothetical protein n=1 Tax=uncultured Flavobacterium sp. TaxID=165435 RepID=UPI00259A367D|nr:hypothetical protein [uncultured Flavobacterium sp.]